MDRRFYFILAGLAILFAIGLFYPSKSPQGSEEIQAADKNPVTALGAGSKTTNETADDPYKAPLDFFGRVIDVTSGEPIPEAEVKVFIVTAPTYPLEQKEISLQTKSDGTFAVLDETGGGIRIAVSKSGYRRSPNKALPSSKVFSYADQLSIVSTEVTTIGSPALFGLSKISNIEGRDIVSIPYRHVRKEDAVRGVEIVQGLKVALAHESRFDAENPRSRGWAWSTELTFLDGGILQRGSEHKWTAPLGDYGQTLSYQTDADSDMSRWQGKLSGHGFFKTENGQYGILHWNVRGRDGRLSYSGWFDRGGGRLLEPVEAHSHLR